MSEIQVIDSHTAGEPTRVIVQGGPDLGDGALSDRLLRFREHFDQIRTGVILEPRGSDVLVGGLLCEPADATCEAGVIFFNNADYLHMCGHGMIGFVVTLHHLGRIGPGTHRIETPVGIVTATLLDANRVQIQNVPSYRYRKAVPLELPEFGTVTGDVVWGGNWFYLVSDHGRELSFTNIPELTRLTQAIRDHLPAAGITGANGGEIDHIELLGPGTDGKSDGRNFVLCPGGAYDRSPCGTGTSAKLAALAADGKLKPDELWRQESIIGSLFEGRYRPAGSAEAVPEGVSPDDVVIPMITGSAWVTAESTLLFDPTDPFRKGIV